MLASPVSWIRSLLTAGVAAYAPFAAMTLYTQLFVACQHCKQATLWLFPGGPGVVGTAWLNQISGIPRLSDAAGLFIAILTSGLFIGLVASFGRLGRTWLIGAALTASLCCSIQAFMIFVVIQM